MGVEVDHAERKAWSAGFERRSSLPTLRRAQSARGDPLVTGATGMFEQSRSVHTASERMEKILFHIPVTVGCAWKSFLNVLFCIDGNSLCTSPRKTM